MGRVGFCPSTVIYELLGDVVTSQTLLLLNEIRVKDTLAGKKKRRSHIVAVDNHNCLRNLR